MRVLLAAKVRRLCPPLQLGGAGAAWAVAEGVRDTVGTGMGGGVGVGVGGSGEALVPPPLLLLLLLLLLPAAAGVGEPVSTFSGAGGEGGGEGVDPLTAAGAVLGVCAGGEGGGDWDLAPLLLLLLLPALLLVSAGGGVLKGGVGCAGVGVVSLSSGLCALTSTCFGAAAAAAAGLSSCCFCVWGDADVASHTGNSPAAAMVVVGALEANSKLLLN